MYSLHIHSLRPGANQKLYRRPNLAGVGETLLSRMFLCTIRGFYVNWWFMNMYDVDRVFG